MFRFVSTFEEKVFFNHILTKRTKKNQMLMINVEKSNYRKNQIKVKRQKEIANKLLGQHLLLLHYKTEL